MNIILADSDKITDHHIQLTDYRAEHIVKVLRSKEGDTVRFGIINGGRGKARIVAIKKKFPFSVDLNFELTESKNDIPPIDLILALPRPIMLKRILGQVTALGVGTIHLIHASRVEKSFWESSLVAGSEFRPHLIHGLEQAIDTRLPKICLHRKFKPFVEDYLPVIKKDCQLRVLAHPEGQFSLVQALRGCDGKKRIALAIGPEGGWVDYEVQRFGQQGFIDFTIGERILKVDTAVVALHAKISLLIEGDS